MPIVSEICHQKVYVQAKDYETRFLEVEKLIIAILNLDISIPLKKRMLVHALWEITKPNGDFKGRFRSKAVLVIGTPIERDHVYQKERIVRCLVEHPNEIRTALNDLIHCVVAKEEHQRLTQISRSKIELDGWQRYQEAGIEVLDMSTGKQVRGDIIL